MGGAGMAAPDDLNARIHAILAGPRTGGRAASSTPSPFSPYDATDVDRASEIVELLGADDFKFAIDFRAQGHTKDVGFGRSHGCCPPAMFPDEL